MHRSISININGQDTPPNIPASSLLREAGKRLDSHKDNTRGCLIATVVIAITAIALVLLGSFGLTTCLMNIFQMILTDSSGGADVIVAVSNNLKAILVTFILVVASVTILVLLLRHRSKQRDAERRHQEAVLNTPLEKFNSPSSPTAEELAEKYSEQ